MKIKFTIPNKYSTALFLCVVAVCFGVAFGGSFQPMRIALAFFFLCYLPQILSCKFDLKKEQPIVLGLSLFMVWIMYGFVSLLWSPSPMAGLMSELMAMSIGFVSLPLFAFLFRRAENPLTIVRKGWLICLLLLSVVSIFNLVAHIHLPSSITPQSVLNRPESIIRYTSATFSNINDYGTVIAFIIPYLLWGAMEGQRGRDKLIYFVAFLLGLLFVIINGQRLGILVIGFQVLCFSFLLLRQLRKKHIVAAIGLVCLAVIILPMDNLLYMVTLRMGDGFFNSLLEALGQGRGMLLMSGLQMLWQSYGFGIGAGGFEEAIIHMPAYNGTYINPHNLLVEIFAQYGIFIFAFFCFWIFSIFIFALKNKYLSKGARMAVLTTVISLPLIGAMQSAALGFTYFWIFLSCITVISVYKPSSKTAVK